MRGIVTLGTRACEAFAAFVQAGKNDAEAGGIMLGRLILDCSDVIVDDATKPHPDDKRSRLFFWRSNKNAQQRVVDAWNGSSGTQIYLGEWHTHPEDVPKPSCVDIQNWNRILGRSRFEQGFLLFVIIGRRETRVWEAGKGRRIESLTMAT